MYLEADEKCTGKRNHLTLFCLLFFFHLDISQPFLSEELVFALFDISIPRLCFGFGVGWR